MRLSLLNEGEPASLKENVNCPGEYLALTPTLNSDRLGIVQIVLDRQFKIWWASLVGWLLTIPR